MLHTQTVYWQRKIWLFGNILPIDRLIDEKLFNKVAILTRESYIVVLVENSNSNLFKVK